MNRPEINVTPLIDVLLVLLIIFMIITPIKPTQVEAKAPREPINDGAQTSPLALVVTVDHERKLGLNTGTFSATIDEPDAIVTRLKEIFLQRTINRAFASDPKANGDPVIEKTVFIKAPKSLDYGSVARVVDAVKSSGANPVGLQLDGLD